MKINASDEPTVDPLLILVAHLLIISPKALGDKKIEQKEFFKRLDALYPHEFRVRSRCNFHPIVTCEKCNKVFDATSYGALAPSVQVCIHCAGNNRFQVDVNSKLMRRVTVEALMTYAPNQFYNNPITVQGIEMQKFWNEHNKKYTIPRDMQVEVGDL